MDRRTIDAYDARGRQWAARGRAVRRSDAEQFATSVAKGAHRIDVGCGAGRYAPFLGSPLIAVDASAAMLEQCRAVAPGTLLLCCDLEELPLAGHAVAGAWANMSYLHVPRLALPKALAELHRILTPGAPVDLQVLHGDYEGHELPDDDIGGRFFAGWRPDALVDVCVGAGFEDCGGQVDGDVVRVRAVRGRTLADTVAARMRLLVVGLNPSLYAADAGVGFARPGNRFWPAALATGMVTRDRDARHALAAHGVGMTDLVKRATRTAAEIADHEYRTGLSRLERLVRWLEPTAVCFVGLAGWRVAVGRNATVGVQPTSLGGRPVYVMPSTSGANAHAQLPELVAHLQAAQELSRHAPDRSVVLQ
ncbi:MAG: uracil-DNA glycosylase family protein [Acidimicrobiales bacterium]